MRLIDADALISFIDPEHLRHSGELTFSEVDVINMLNHAPTAFDVEDVGKEELGKWIPCSERLPEKPVAGEDCYLSQAQYVEQSFVSYWDGHNWTDECYEKSKHVIAWRPVPKPYREME